MQAISQSVSETTTSAFTNETSMPHETHLNVDGLLKENTSINSQLLRNMTLKTNTKTFSYSLQIHNHIVYCVYELILWRRFSLMWRPAHPLTGS